MIFEDGPFTPILVNIVGSGCNEPSGIWRPKYSLSTGLPISSSLTSASSFFRLSLLFAATSEVLPLGSLRIPVSAEKVRSVALTERADDVNRFDPAPRWPTCFLIPGGPLSIPGGTANKPGGAPMPLPLAAGIDDAAECTVDADGVIVDGVIDTVDGDKGAPADCVEDNEDVSPTRLGKSLSFPSVKCGS
jgi:hypothetical protein